MKWFKILENTEDKFVVKLFNMPTIEGNKDVIVEFKSPKGSEGVHVSSDCPGGSDMYHMRVISLAEDLARKYWVYVKKVGMI